MERWRAEFHRLLQRPQALALGTRYFPHVSVLLFLLDAVATAGIIWRVPYTEIDWVAYMQEVEGALNGTLDYSQLRGDTGPLVYPAGFVYVYSLFYFLTGGGGKVAVAQVLFAGLYLLNLLLVTSIYSRVARSLRLPPYILLFLTCTAYRVHSIFVLRMFNDPVAMLLLHCSLLCLVRRLWLPTAALFSVAVSVKMNVLLYAPGLLVVFLLTHGWAGTLPLISLCALLQVALGAPFLLSSPVSYMRGAFDFGRQFLYQWTVNWRCLPEWLFLHRGFHTVLLACHIALLAAFIVLRWTRFDCYM
ncbi:Dol-P-Man:Man(5)GlcNAc(2)-PP-Dol alpha-1,3-mannosyltransferase [Geodia barretti]|uniref:dolichyl-P-Man:Man5GlcNAc2-PP-dolichol alpha-1,3-mannosyltransferase n=1 Tax=Geodia barretti TaxID=519541 RepID=A0AA35S8I2_GEOBA|nr:Dol-P-Man:Man(5)GlcNAc(2)-PP-Dol alpha-1,3-mannosyltransferase [Geodia barretti]